MVSGNKAGLFNVTFAVLAGGASAFAIFAMPQALLAGSIEDIGLSGLIGLPVGDSARLGTMGAAAALASLLAWLALRSCDPPRTLAVAVTDKDLVDSWLGQRLNGRTGSSLSPEIRPWLAEEVLELDDPFVELARGAEPIEPSFESRPEQTADQPAAPANDDYASFGITDMPTRMEPPAPQAEATEFTQQLNAGLIEGEWPLPSGDSGEQADDVDRLRRVLFDLQSRTRGS